MREVILTYCACLCFFPLSAQQVGDLLRSYEKIKHIDADKAEQLIISMQIMKASSDSLEVERFRVIAQHYMNEGRYYAADPYYDSAMALIPEISIEQRTDLLLDIGTMNSSLTNNAQAWNYYKEAIEQSKLTADDVHVSKSYRVVSEYFRKLGKYELAQAYIDSALSYVDTSEADPSLIASILNRKAAIFTETGNGEESLKFSWRALKYANRAGDKNLQAVSHNEIGFVMSNINAEDGLAHLQKAMELWEEIGYERYQASAMVNYSRFLLRAEKVDSALRVINRCLKLAEGKSWLPIEKDAYEFLTKIYKGKGNYKMALETFEKQVAAQFKLESTSHVDNVERLTAEFKSAMKDAQLSNNIKALQKLKEKTQSQRRLNRVLIAISIILALTIIAIGILMSLNKYRRKALERQAKLIKSMNLDLKAALHNQETLLREVHHRVKNNLQVIASMLDLQSESNESPEISSALDEAKTRVMSMSLIHEKIFQDGEFSKVYLDNYIMDLHNEVASIFAQSQVRVKTITEFDKVSVPTDMAINLGILLNELLTNSYKYAFKPNTEGELYIAMKAENEQQVRLIYRDSGPGLGDNFEIHDRNSLGMRLIRNMVRQLKGELTYSFNDGTQFEIEFNID